MKKTRSILTIFSLILSLYAISIVFATPNSINSITAKLLEKTRCATTKYHDVSIVLADG